MVDPKRLNAEREIEAIVAAAHANGIEPEVPFVQLVGIIVETLRTSAGFSQEKLCASAKISQSTLSRIENGETPLDVAQAYRIAQALEIHTSVIFESASALEKLLENKQTKITGYTVSSSHNKESTSSKISRATLGSIIGGALLGPVGLLAGSITGSIIYLSRNHSDNE